MSRCSFIRVGQNCDVFIGGQFRFSFPSEFIHEARAIARQYVGQPDTPATRQMLEDELRRMVRDMEESRYIKEDTNMVRRDSLKHSLKAVFGGVNPLDFIQDMEVQDNICGNTKVYLTLDVPRVYAPGLKERAVEVVKTPQPLRVHFSGPKTVIIWDDGTKTIVSVSEDETFDEYAGFCAAIVKKMFGSTTQAKKFLSKVRVENKSKKKDTPARLEDSDV